MTDLEEQVRKGLNDVKIDFGGGCSFFKGYLMASLIKKYKLKTTLDIGVYRGRSLYPQAIAHKHTSGGLVYGVDPWKNSEVYENDNVEIKSALDKFLKETDFNLVHKEVEMYLHNNQLTRYAKLMRKTSRDAYPSFVKEGITFDLIHIDGNHDTKLVEEDVELYLPLLKKNGLLVMDDVSWDSIKPVLKELNKVMSPVFTLTDNCNDFTVYLNSKSALRCLLLKLNLRIFQNLYLER